MQEARQGHASVEERKAALGTMYPNWEKRTIATHFYKQCQQYSKYPLIMMPDEVVTYEEIWGKARDYAKALLHLGVSPEDHVAILMENEPDYVALFIASSLVGAVVVPLNTQLQKEELTYMLHQSDTNWLITHQFASKQNHAEALKEVVSNLQEDAESPFKKAVCIPNKGADFPSVYMDWNVFLQGGKEVEDAALNKRWKETDAPDACAAIIYTSGSTGLPKGVMLTDDMLLRSGFATCLTRAYETGRRIYVPLPMYHVYFLQEGLLAASFVGGGMVTCHAFQPLQSLDLMEKYQVHDFLAVPSMLVALLNRPEVEKTNLEHLYALLCCAAPSPVPLWKRAVEKLEVTEIGTGCGGTEASSTTMLTEIGDSLETISTTVGKVKTAGVAGHPEFGDKSVMYKVIDPDSGNTLPSGSVGELAVRGNVVTKGYYKKPEETSFAIDKEGYIRSGDLGTIDENGYIRLLGRSKDLYKVSGETVAPKEVEDIISMHPAVNQVYIVGVPDQLTTETGAAFIELKQGESCSKQEIRNLCREHVARFKIPRYIWFVEASEWPLTGTGKIQKFKLQEAAEERLKK
ncbi:class I adenylate-forming enzyme family protein [Oceanobacillus sp. J11TS1]|uniref:class I adenylate-forming enzyme family protein n=1 Tax=Oceanobacillus sp. J11TS1 TaxID=2807191 RepID=UPI001B00CFE0|nr:class I adenylate-forming enzyme family protein [Oceanobacillus sp. J11TS1]GIO23598.1 AMP-binding protein [Oceanobacillus sp. J11TS1]